MGSNKRTVLYVDPEGGFPPTAADQLLESDTELEVVEAASVADAIGILEDRTVDCIVSVNELVETNGLEFLWMVRDRDGDCPFILYPANGSERLAGDAVAAGATHYVAQSDDPEKLVARIRNDDGATTKGELERYETIIETSGDFVYQLDADGRFTFVNDRFFEEAGYRKSELIGSHVSDVMDEADIVTAESLIRSLLKSGEQHGTFEMSLELADGTRIPCENHLAILPFDEEFRGTTGVIRDISEQSEREQKIVALHQQTRELLRVDGVTTAAESVVSAAADVLGFEMNAVRLFDEDTGTLEAVAVSDAVRKALGERPLYQIGEGAPGEAFERGEPLLYENVRARDDGIDRGPVRSAMYLPVGDFGVVSITDTEPASFTDIDQALAMTLADNAAAVFRRLQRERTLENREEELRRQNKRLDEFASFVSHDLRNPVTVASGYLELAQADCNCEHLDELGEAIHRIDELIEETLDAARHGQTVTDPEPVDLVGLVWQCWHTIDSEDLTHSAREDARLRVTDEITVRGDPHRLQTLFENLLRNAFEHAGSDVTIRVGPLDDGFFFEDDGSGLPDDAHDAIFEKGYSTSDVGTGFGLAIVRDIVEAHGWTIVPTTGPSDGARFEIRDVE